MVRKIILATFCVLFLLASVVAAFDTFIQTGTKDCDLKPPGGRVTGDFPCGVVTFAHEFGAPPQVSVAFSRLSLGNSTITITARGITTKQFMPHITVERASAEPVNTGSGGFGEADENKKNEQITGYVPDRYTISWIAVGPRKKRRRVGTRS
jgi:H-type lectin domain